MKNKNERFLCLFCDGVTETKVISVTFKRRKREFTFHNIEAEVCQKCSETYYDSKSFLKKDNREVEEIEKQILIIQEEIRQLRIRRAEEKRLESKKRSKPKGRPKLNPDLIEKAREMAKTRNLTDVALSLDVSLNSLYRYGISRATINKKIAEEKLLAISIKK